jgi:hypothetical protein
MIEESEADQVLGTDGENRCSDWSWLVKQFNGADVDRHLDLLTAYRSGTSELHPAWEGRDQRGWNGEIAIKSSIDKGRCFTRDTLDGEADAQRCSLLKNSLGRAARVTLGFEER